MALLALWIGGDRKAAVDFLKLSVSYKKQSMEAKKRKQKADRPTTLAGSYRQLLYASATALLEGESIAKLEMAKAILGIRTSKRATKRSK